MKARQSAMTLVEMLAAIAIVATLATALGVASASFKDKAKVSKSLSNLRQIALAINEYANDNQDRFPSGYFYQSGQGETTYITAISPYLSETPSPLNPQRNIFIAPTSAIPMPPKTAANLVPMTYSVHGVLCPDTSSGTVSPPRRISVARPSQVILVGDGAQNPTSGNSLSTFTSPTQFKQTGSTQNLDNLIPTGSGFDSDTSAGLGQLRYRSGGCAAVAMVDGHVELLKRGTVTYRYMITDR